MNQAKSLKRLYLTWLGLLGIAITIGLIAAFRLLTEGHYLFNSNDVLIWSLPLGVYIFLALTSSGLTLLASLPLVFGVKKYEPFAKRLVFLAIATLLAGFISIGLELGNVFHMIYIIFSPNFSSPIWWMGAIYSLELVVLVLKFWKLHIGDWNSSTSKALGKISLLCALIAPLMIGSVFGLTESRVTYFGPVMSIYCLFMAILSGISLCLLYNLIHAMVTGNGISEKKETLFKEFTPIFTGALGAMIILTLIKLFIEHSTVVPEFLNYHKYAQAFGSIAGINTEIILGLFLPFILISIPGVRHNQNGRLITFVLVFLGNLAMHMEILLAGQSHPVGPKAEQFPEYISYFPSIWEWIVFMFSVAVMLLLFTLGERYLRLEEAHE
ncbi:MAG: polysulfide reductase NrfD [Deltaproteobacteria bacterium]|nr:polysulfide reductase NrfD [Deltaproteobacteria bacterium]MBW1812352.1 polysulfide reductase NrfD [Deltaproteobacteria bacterium]MBW1846941.1 polysulfide reductase NrfD [Deltaproteobacteria bacterium]MBW2363645.1 polysulfide reductase NrfD [Deltaproteobacteria bacterium]